MVSSIKHLASLTIALVLAAPGGGALAQTAEEPLYLHCVAAIPADRAEAGRRDVIYRFDGVWMARWYPDQGTFVYEIDKNTGGGFDPYLSVNPAEISYQLYTAGSLQTGVWINRATGAYRVQRTWFGLTADPRALDVTGTCTRTTRPTPPTTRF